MAGEERLAELTPSIYPGLPRRLSSQESACQGRRPGFDGWVGKIPWRRAWQPTPVFLPGDSHGPRSLVGYSPWGCRVRHDGATKQQQHDNRAVSTSLPASGSCTLLPAKSWPLISSFHGGLTFDFLEVLIPRSATAK